MIEQALNEILHGLAMLSHVQNSNGNCRSRLNAGNAEFVDMSQLQATLIQCRITLIPEIESALVLRHTLSRRPKSYLARTDYVALIEECQNLLEPTLKLRLREAGLLGHKVMDRQLAQYGGDWVPPSMDIDRLLEETRDKEHYRYPCDLYLVEQRIQEALQEYKERDLPPKQFLCAFHGGNPNWQAVTVEAKDRYTARVLALALWLGVNVKEVGIQHEWEMRHTSMTEVAR